MVADGEYNGDDYSPISGIILVTVSLLRTGVLDTMRMSKIAGSSLDPRLKSVSIRM